MYANRQRRKNWINAGGGKDHRKWPYILCFEETLKSMQVQFKVWLKWIKTEEQKLKAITAHTDYQRH